MKRWWISWYVPEEAFVPLTNPPNTEILGWWCTGYDASGRAILCGLVEAPNLVSAKQAIRKDWAVTISWRFSEERPDDYVLLSDRFPINGWMIGRMGRAA